MERRYYYVCPRDALWELYPEDRLWTETYPTRRAAADAGEAQAKRDHEVTGHPTGLRVRVGVKAWLEQRKFGGDPLASSCPMVAPSPA